MKKTSYSGYRFPPEIIQQAIWLYLRFTLSLRDVEDLLAERGVAVSYETVRRWVNHFGPSARDHARAVGAHLAGQTNTIDGCRADHGILGGIQAVTQHGQTRCLRQDPPTEKGVRNAIERTTVSATRIEIVLNESGPR